MNEDVEKLIVAYKSYRNSHKHLPTDENPLKLKKALFYSEYLMYKEQKIPYDSIYGLLVENSKKTTNYVFNEIKITFQIYHKTPTSSQTTYIDLSYRSEILGWRVREITSILIQFLEQKTFSKRLEKYFNEVKTNGYLNYEKCKIYNNGDIHYKDKFIANLYEENKNDNLWFGVAFSSMIGRNKLTDPYILRLKNVMNNTNIFQKKDFDINTQYNKDVFDFIISEILKKGILINS